MRIAKGDIVYGSDGRPGVVLDRDPITKKVQVENQGQEYQRTRHVGFINGLKADERNQFYEIIEAVRTHAEPEKRIEALQYAIDELDKDPRNLQLVRYLKSERAHVMFSEKISPRVYTMDGAKL